jgi:hypothetical protein
MGRPRCRTGSKERAQVCRALRKGEARRSSTFDVLVSGVGKMFRHRSLSYPFYDIGGSTLSCLFTPVSILLSIARIVFEDASILASQTSRTAPHTAVSPSRSATGPGSNARLR